jgi:hypothetical protein
LITGRLEYALKREETMAGDKSAKSAESHEFAYFYHNYKKHLVRIKDLKGGPGVVKLPDGVLLDRTQLGVEYSEKPPKVYGTNPEWNTWGSLPILPVVEAVLAED